MKLTILRQFHQHSLVRHIKKLKMIETQNRKKKKRMTTRTRMKTKTKKVTRKAKRAMVMKKRKKKMMTREKKRKVAFQTITLLMLLLKTGTSCIMRALEANSMKLNLIHS